MGARAAPAIPALIAALREADPPEGGGHPESEELEDDTSSQRSAASACEAALRGIGPASVPPLLRLIKSTEPKARVQAVRTIGALGPDAKPAVPHLIGLLSHPDIRAEAASALGRIGMPARAAVPMLISAVKNRDPALRIRAAEALGRIGEHALHQMRPSTSRTVVSALAAALKDPDRRVRAAAATACARIGPQASAASPELVTSLSDSQSSVRLASLRALGRFVQHSDPEQNALLGCLKDADRRIRVGAAKAIAASDLGSDAVIAGLLAALNDPDADVRAAAAGRLVCTNGKGGYIVTEDVFDHTEADNAALVRSPIASAVLRAAVLDPDRRVRAAAAYLLPVFKQDASVAVHLLIDRLKDPAVVVRVAAAKSLGQLGPSARPAVPALLQALSDPGRLPINNFNVSTKAAEALIAVDPENRQVVFDRLLAGLADPRENVRESTAAALGSLKDEPTASSRLYRALAEPRTSLPLRRRILEILAAEGMGGGMMGAGEPEPAAPQPERRAAIPTLCELAEDPDEDIALCCDQAPGRDRSPGSPAHPVDPGRGTQGDSVPRPGRGQSRRRRVVGSTGLDPGTEGRKRGCADRGRLCTGRPGRRRATTGGERPWRRQARARPGGGAEEPTGPQGPDQPTPCSLCSAIPIPRSAGLPRGRSGHRPRVRRSRIRRVLQALTAIARDRSTRVRRDAWIRVAEAVTEDGLADTTGQNADGEKLRIAAIQALAGFGERASSAVPDLIEALKDDDPAVRRSAVQSLGSVGAAAHDAVPALIDLLQPRTTPRHAWRCQARLVRIAPGGGRDGSRQDRPRRPAPPFRSSSGPSTIATQLSGARRPWPSARSARKIPP